MCQIFFIHFSLIDQVSLYTKRMFYVYTQDGTAGSWRKLVSIFLKNFHSDFNGGYTRLPSHQQWMSVSVTEYPQQHELSPFNTLIILTHAIWNFKVDFICIFLMIGDVKLLFKCLSAIRVTRFDNSLYFTTF